MVGYMEKFLEPFQLAPYKITREGGNWYRITNAFSGISFVVKGYRGEVYRREEGLYEWETSFVWKPVSSARLKRELGVCNERENFEE